MPTDPDTLRFCGLKFFMFYGVISLAADVKAVEVYRSTLGVAYLVGWVLGH